MSAENFFVHSLLRAHDWQHRPQLDDVCQWWRGGGRGVLALVGMGGAGKTAIVERFLRVLPDGLPANPDVPKDGSLPTPHGVFVFSFYDAPNPEAFFEALQMWLEHTPRVQAVLSLQQMIFLLQHTPGLMVLDGLEKVQEDGVRGLLGRLASSKLREFLDRIAAGYFPELSVLVTSRFPLADLRDARPQFFRLLPIEEIEVPAGIRLLRARGVCGADLQLASIVDACGRHALTVDFAGGYIAEFGGGDPATPVDFEMDSERLRQRLDDEPDEARRRVLKQGHRFARLAERYREAMRGDTADQREGDAAALALLERICLFRLGVEAETLANIFTGEKAVNVSGPALAGLSRAQLQKKLDWLVRMRIVESQSTTRNPQPAIRYSIHPAVRDGFLSGIGDAALRDNHEAVRRGLQVSLGDVPGKKPSDPATLDLLEEIVHHTLQSGHVSEAWDIYWNRIGRFGNLGRRLGQPERGLRICRLFLQLAESGTVLNKVQRSYFYNNLGLFSRELGMLADALEHFGKSVELRRQTGHSVALGLRNVSICLRLMGRIVESHDKGEQAIKESNVGEDLALSNANLGYLKFLQGDVDEAIRLLKVYSVEKALRDAGGNLMLYPITYYAESLQRIGRTTKAGQILESIHRKSNEISYELDLHRTRLLLALLHCELREVDEAITNRDLANDWAEARGAKHLLCWSALVQTQIECSASSPERAHKAVEDGLKIARDCGFGIYHIDLLLERARLHLMSGAPQAALDDLRTALDDGVPFNPQTGQPELLAAMHSECGYAWGIAAGLQLRGEALLLQAANEYGQPTFDPAQRATLPAAVRDLIAQAEACLTESLARWHKLKDPSRNNSNFRHPKTGKQYNYRAAETHRVLTELAGGVLTNYPLAKLQAATDVKNNAQGSTIMATTYKYDALISYRHQDPDKAFARALLQRLEAAGLKVAIDERDFDPVATFLEEMERCIKESRYTLAVMSPRYLESGNCEEEAIICKVLDMAERRRRIIPLTIEAVTMPVWLYNIVGINFTETNPLVEPHAKLIAKLQTP